MSGTTVTQLSFKSVTLPEKEFLVDCFNNCYQINDFKQEVEDFNSLCLYLDDESIYKVHKNGKNIGFFTLDLDHHSKAVGATVFIHPSVCSLAIITLLRTCVLTGMAYSVVHTSEFVEFDSWSQLLVREVKKLLPMLQIYTVRPQYIICHAPIDVIHNQAVLESHGLDAHNIIKTGTFKIA